MMRHPVTGKDKSSFGVTAHQVLKIYIILCTIDFYLFELAQNI